MRFKEILLSVLLIFSSSMLGFGQDTKVTDAVTMDEFLDIERVTSGNVNMLWKSQILSLSPTYTIGAEPFTDPERNFVPSSNLSYAGDVNGDGYDDFYYSVFAGDETTPELTDRVNKMVIFYGSTSGISLNDSELLVNSFTFLADINGDGISESIKYEDGVISLVVDESGGNLDTIAEIDLLEIAGLEIRSHGDFNGDGFNDILAFNEQAEGNMATLYMMYGAANYADVNIDTLKYATGIQGVSNKMAYADVDNDGTSEIISISGFNDTQDAFGAVTAYQVNGSDTLQTVGSDTLSADLIGSRFHVSSFGTYMGLADLNNDGNYELTFFNYFTGDLNIFELSDVAGEVYTQESIIYTDSGLNIYAIVGDYNANGGTDLVVAGDDRVQLVTSDANLNFSSTSVVLSEGEFVNFVENPTSNINGGGDVNGDGIADLIFEVSNSNADTYGYRVYFGNSNGNFNSTSEITYNEDNFTNDTPDYVFNTGDINSDGIDDYGIVYRRSSDVHIYFGGTFSEGASADVIIDNNNDVTIYSPSTGDFNGDGLSDVIISSSRSDIFTNDAKVDIYFGGQGFNNISDHTIQFSDVYPDTIGSLGNVRSIGDINNDGYDDMMLISEQFRENSNIIFGGSTIGTSSDLELPFFAHNFGPAGDFNDDGIEDFAVAYNNVVYIHAGFDEPGGASFDATPLVTIPAPQYNGTSIFTSYSFFGHSITTGDFDGDSISDLAFTSVFHVDYSSGAAKGAEAIRIYNGSSTPDSLADGYIYIKKDDFATVDNASMLDTLDSNLGTISSVPDQNGDGAHELMFTGYGFSTTNAAVYYGGDLDTMGTNIGVYLEAPNQAVGLGPYANYIYAGRGVPAVGDFDNDNKNDYILPQIGEFNFQVDPVYVYSSDQIGVANEEEVAEIREFRLNQNYPNPFNPTTRISYNLPSTGEVKLQVFDITGRLVSTVVDQRQMAGSYTLNFDASHLASGIYIYRLQASGLTKTRKMTLIK